MVRSTILSRMTVWTYALMGVALGAVTIIGGPVRWTGDFYQLVRMAPGAPESWGAAILIGGAVTAVGSLTRHNRLRNLGLAIMCTWMGVFSITGATSAYLTPTVGLTAPPIFVCVTVAMAVLMFTDESRDREPT